ncbi:hypothetical protein L1987_05374 [Smallanthus sonchifolius]|uniref:Uncharacterized protein n=1 Tax=Smallanthus sonchifolius TaxID=185202 RepID=A0ACB9JV63_9ASTR|nr:hypothetical protein L1987_05374 [Smallanthus sonchifolius]
MKLWTASNLFGRQLANKVKYAAGRVETNTSDRRSEHSKKFFDHGFSSQHNATSSRFSQNSQHDAVANE